MHGQVKFEKGATIQNRFTKPLSRFECPYHGWTYSTSGRLTKAKRLKGIQDFSAKNFSLIPISVQQWGPFIFINLSSKNDRIVSTDFAEVRTSMENEVGPFDHGMKFVKRVVYDVESNWKVSTNTTEKFL
mgnify:FL=1